MGKANSRIFELEKENASLLEVIRIISTAECKNPNKPATEDHAEEQQKNSDEGWTTVNRKKKKKSAKQGSAQQANQQNQPSAASTQSTTQKQRQIPDPL